MSDGTNKQLIFISYSSFDTETKEFVQRHFGVLQHLGDVEIWEDSQIGLGDDWFQAIETKLESCSVAVLLISHDFLGSKFCMKKEVPILLERRKRDGMMIAPILLSPCAWDIIPWLRAIQMLPRKSKPLLALDEIEQAEKLTEVVRTIHAFLEQHRESVAKADVAPQIELKADTPYEKPLAVDTTRLPTSGFDVVGRDKELQFLNEAFDDDQLNIVSLRTWGGVGKSTLVNKWCEYLAADNYRGARRVFAWSFYSQGTGGGQSGTERMTSADAFIDEALRFFEDDDPTAGSPWAKGERLAELVSREKTLLILDGMEPLQEEHQGIKDPALARLVECLAEENAGLCVITTREPVKEFADFPDTTREVDLEQLSKEAGRALLRIKGLRATDDLLERVSEAFGNHALALNLLASLLKRFAGGDVSKALAIPDLPNVKIEDGKHPRRVMTAYADHFGEGIELDLLHTIGLFDRPADAGCIFALREQAVPGLTERLSALNEMGWRDLLEKLRSFGLLAEASQHVRDELDAHPLVREHFGAWLRVQWPDVWKAGHERLYGHLQSVPEKHQPDTLAEMAPLFQAVYHGCKGGRYQEVLDKVYYKRIVREREAYLLDRLGAYGADLGLVASFFEQPFERPADGLTENSSAQLLHRAGLRLRAIGRLFDAISPIETALNMAVKHKKWNSAVGRASNLSSIQLYLGDMSSAVEVGEAAVSYAKQIGVDLYNSIWSRTTLANAKHHSGALHAAMTLFEEAEKIQMKRQPEYSKLYSFHGHRYNNLLLTLGNADAVQERAVFALTLAWEQNSLLDIADAHLSSGKAALALGNWDEAQTQLNQGVDGLRKAGTIHLLPNGLLPRAALFRRTKEYEKSRHDLVEVMRLAKRCGMRLFECDAHLEYAHLALAEGRCNVRPHFRSAQQLVAACGYHRRDPEIAELKEKLDL